MTTTATGKWSLSDRWKNTRPVGRTHGLRSTYTHGCRCVDCREAERIYRSQHRRQQRLSGHG